MEHIGSYRIHFHEILYFKSFLKTVDTKQFSLKSGENNRYVTWGPMYIYGISRWILLRMKNVSDKLCRKNQNKHPMFSNFFSRKACRLWNNIKMFCITVQTTDDNTFLCMLFGCWITNATDAHSEYVILIAFSPATMVMRTRVNVTLFVRPTLPPCTSSLNAFIIIQLALMSGKFFDSYMSNGWGISKIWRVSMRVRTRLTRTLIVTNDVTRPLLWAPITCYVTVITHAHWLCARMAGYVVYVLRCCT
jgi:hypothetical protein